MRSIFLVLLALGSTTTSAAAQNDVPTTVFECTLNGGANTVNIDAFPSNDLRYSYANAVGQLELNIDSHITQVTYSPFAWDSPEITESVTFYNGDTSYEVFSRRVSPDRTTGGIIVTTPAGARTELPCDAYSISPGHPQINIGQLAQRYDPNHDPFRKCLAGTGPATTCVGVYTTACLSSALADASEDACLTAELTLWEALLDQTRAAAMDMAQARQFGTDELTQAKPIWEASRDHDCDMAAWTVYDPFDGKLGKLMCLADVTAQRVTFLRHHINGMEFDG